MVQRNKAAQPAEEVQPTEAEAPAVTEEVAPEASTEAKPKKAKTLHPCRCSAFTVIQPTSDGVNEVTLDCDKQTTSNFAPGHDARLKSLLLKAHRAGHQVRVQDREHAEPVTMSAKEAASPFGFVHEITDAKVKASSTKAEGNGQPESTTVVDEETKGSVEEALGV